MPNIALRWAEATEARGYPRRRRRARVHERRQGAGRQAVAGLGSPELAPANRQLFAKLILWMNGAGVIGIFALMFLICADITARTVFDDPIRGVTEIVSLSLVACVFLQLPLRGATKRG